jgi:hypothetical protein
MCLGKDTNATQRRMWKDRAPAYSGPIDRAGNQQGPSDASFRARHELGTVLGEVAKT